jgi:hypothetical protein
MPISGYTQPHGYNSSGCLCSIEIRNVKFQNTTETSSLEGTLVPSLTNVEFNKSNGTKYKNL